MSCAGRSAPDTQAFIATVDRFAAEFGLPAYSEIACAIHDQDQRATGLYASLHEVSKHVGEAQLLVARTGLEQPKEDLDRLLTDALERITAAKMVADIALFTAETRVDLDGRDDVVVLADARTRLRAAGRRL